MIIIPRAIVIGIYFLTVALLGIVVCLFRPFNPDNTRICGRMFSWGGRKILGLKVTDEGLEHLNQNTPGVVISNHQDNIDLFVHSGIVPSRTVTVGKKSLKYIPFFGQVYWLSGNIMIDRSNMKSSLSAMLKVSEIIQHKDTSIWVYPEGTRSKGKDIGKFKKGAFLMAVQAEAPITIICTSSYKKNIKLNKLNSCEVILKVLPSISTKGMTKADIPKLMDEAQMKLEAGIKELDARLERNV